jgi:F-type H+-transporting ATPase subunit a|tara:strand:+ start:223 stop:1218 length:996 start_codon:yes stop_codon:yes gene_type:complete
MFLARIAALLILLTGAPLCLAENNSSASNADSNEAAAGQGGEHGEEHHGLTPYAPVLYYGIGGHAPTDPHDPNTAKFGPLAVSNSMFVTIIVALGIIVVAQLATRKVKLIPSGLQNFVEYLVEGLYGFFESIVGPQMVKQTFWFFATIFIFILFSNWFGLLPGMGTVGWDVDSSGHVHKPLLRGVNADVNMTLSMAVIFMVLWIFWSLKALGPGGVAGHLFNVKGHGAGFFGLFLVVVFIFVGMIEIVSITVRPMALTFRLYGNIFAGENILETVMKLGGPYFGWLVVLPFYLLEILVGLVQALVFALLTSVFTALMCEHHGDDHGEKHAH